MKICKTCGKEKELSQFNLRGKNRPGEVQNSCKECLNLIQRDYKRKMSNLVKRWKMSKGCCRCGFKAEHSCQLDIDHIIPKRKQKTDRQAINTSWSYKRLKEELNLCQVLCANCHRLKSYEDGTMFQKSDSDKIKQDIRVVNIPVLAPVDYLDV